MSTLLICSLGNPAPYAKTLHSAGHVLLSALNKSLGVSSTSQELIKDRALGNGLTATHVWSSHETAGPHDWTLWQSTSYMNVSGPGIRAAWAEYTRRRRDSAAPRLVIVHDEMREDDKPFGTLRLRADSGKLSARGHNGLKSVAQSLAFHDWVRVGINIGRPAGRDPKTVSDYVLKKMTPGQISAIELAAERFKVEILGLLEQQRMKSK